MEATGLALGAIPILIQGHDFYNNGVDRAIEISNYRRIFEASGTRTQDGYVQVPKHLRYSTPWDAFCFSRRSEDYRWQERMGRRRILRKASETPGKAISLLFYRSHQNYEFVSTRIERAIWTPWSANGMNSGLIVPSPQPKYWWCWYIFVITRHKATHDCLLTKAFDAVLVS